MKRLVIPIAGVAAIVLLGAGAALATGGQLRSGSERLQGPSGVMAVLNDGSPSPEPTHHESGHDEDCSSSGSESSDQGEDRDADDHHGSSPREANEHSQTSEQECSADDQDHSQHSEKSVQRSEHVEVHVEQHHS